MLTDVTDPTTARTIPDLVRRCAYAYPDRDAVVDGAVRLSFPQLADEVERFARALIGHGVAPGDRVAIWAPNGWRWVVAALGTVSAGAVLVPINTRFKGAEAAYILGRTRARLLVTEDGFLGNHYVAMLDDQELPHLSTVVVTAGEPPESAHRVVLGWDGLLAAGVTVPVEQARRRAADVAPDDLCDIFFTSGTTGHPKGVMLAHGQTIALYVSWSQRATLRPGDRCLLVNPFFHTFGYKAGVLACLLRGTTIVPQSVLDVPATMDLIERERITVLPGPPTLYTSILDHPERGGRDLSSLRVAVTGATTVPVVLIERLRTELAMPTVVTAYGLTESGGTATMCQPDDTPVTVATTCGAPVPEVEVRVVGLDGVPLPPGEPGEVLIRGYNVTRGYFEDEAATRAAIDGDGWLHTGDIGVLDQRGYLRITDRLKDMFIVGGFNAYPAEIEQALLRHPALAEAAVVGVPDERLGEVGRAFVVPRPGTHVEPAEIVAFCRANLANYKVPRSVVVVEELPRNASGKVFKSRLRTQM
ncbi:3-((3aS,4S,7aS)-7a-methyl-1,5-dioxo-octahydro-1H- inden-4-yl)propanoate--CoA ligase FadD3 [Micromonospora sonneratiae]|uniref:FadD3 family acyl-CoA ligase n=1 Tax=Micromonospora sonneratiae TaxID=1184706 RepID=A0ABW3Y8C4_9ACTN